MSMGYRECKDNEKAIHSRTSQEHYAKLLERLAARQLDENQRERLRESGDSEEDWEVRVSDVKFVKRIRQSKSSESPDGRFCARCEELVLYGDSMYVITASDGSVRCVDYFCEDCYEEGEELSLVEGLFEDRRHDRKKARIQYKK